MAKFSNSGLYKQPFYKKVSDLVYDQDFLLDTLCDNYEVFFKHYASEIEELGETKSQIINQITDLLLLKLYGERLYFDPLVFNPDIALECGLIPLTTPRILELIITACIVAVRILSMFLYCLAVLF